MERLIHKLSAESVVLEGSGRGPGRSCSGAAQAAIPSPMKAGG